MSTLRRNSERFFYRNRNRGISNLMLFIAIGNAVVYLFSMIDSSNLLYMVLCFDREAVLRGEVWRLLSYVLVDLCEGNFYLGAIALFVYVQFARMLEQSWGVCKFNCYYLLGIVLMDIAALLLPYSVASAAHLNVTLFIAVATMMPEAQVRIWFVLPVKMRWAALVSLGFILFEVIRGIRWMLELLPALVYCGWLLPLVALVPYLLFCGGQMRALLPLRWQTRPKREKPSPHWADKYRSASGQAPYRFRCTVCGRTDTQYPSLEFRYCSRCTGYRCYCADHINNHAHIIG